MKRFAVAQPEAVETLFDKLLVRTRNRPEWERLVRASGRAHARYNEVGTPDARGFYHGLLTGYAVAIKALQGKTTVSRR